MLKEISQLNPTTFKVVFDQYSEVEIGNIERTDFEPHAKLKRWGDECFIKVSLPTTKKIPPVLEGGKVKWKDTDKEIHFFPLEPRLVLEEHTGREFSQLEKGGFEFNVVLKQKPITPEITLSFEAHGLKFFRQEALHPDHPTWNTNGEGKLYRFQPENVVGSYAVYLADRVPMHPSKEIADKYKGCKAFHIYYPYLIDSNGWKVRAESFSIELDENGIGKMRVRMPDDFWNNAIYPVEHAAGATFGEEDHGAGGVTLYANDWKGAIYAAPEAGDATSLTFEMTNAFEEDRFKAMLVLHSSLNIVANGIGNEVKGDPGKMSDWYTSIFGTSPTLVASTEYCLGVIAGDNATFHIDGVGAGYLCHSDTPNNYASPSHPTDATHSNHNLCVYCTYEPGAPPLTQKDLQSIGSIKTSQIQDLKSKAGIQIPAVTYRKDLETKGNISITVQKDLKTKANLWKSVRADLSSKGNLVLSQLKDLQDKASIWIVTSQDLQSQGNLFLRQLKNLKSRARVKVKNQINLQTQGNLWRRYWPHHGPCLSFDGDNDYVDVGNHSSLDFTTENFSIEMWLKIKTFGIGVLFFKGGYGDKGYYIQLCDGDSIKLETNQSGQEQATAGKDFSAGEWFHLAIVRIGSVCKIYRNAEEVAYRYQGDHEDPATSNLDALIGRYSAGYSFDGLIDEVRAYGRALSEKEIKEHYQGVFKNEAGLQGLWHFNEGSGETTADDSPNENIGTLLPSGIGPTWEVVGPPAPLISIGNLGTGRNWRILQSQANIQGFKDLKSQGNIWIPSIERDLKSKASVLAVTSRKDLESKALLSPYECGGWSKVWEFSVSFQKVLGSQANINRTYQQDLSSRANLQKITRQDLKSQGYIKIRFQRILSSIANILCSLQQNLQTRGSIKVPQIERILNSKANIIRIYQKDLKLKGNILRTLTRNLKSKASIKIPEIEQTIESKGNILRIYQKALESKASLWRIRDKDLSSKADLFIRQWRGLKSKANILKAISQDLQAQGFMELPSGIEFLQSKANIWRAYQADLKSRGDIFSCFRKDLKSKASIKVPQIEQVLESRASIKAKTIQTLQSLGNLFLELSQVLRSYANIFVQVQKNLQTQADLFIKAYQNLRSRGSLFVRQISDLKSQANIVISRNQGLQSKAWITAIGFQNLKSKAGIKTRTWQDLQSKGDIPGVRTQNDLRSKASIYIKTIQTFQSRASIKTKIHQNLQSKGQILKIFSKDLISKAYIYPGRFWRDLSSRACLRKVAYFWIEFPFKIFTKTFVFNIIKQEPFLKVEIKDLPLKITQ